MQINIVLNENGNIIVTYKNITFNFNKIEKNTYEYNMQTKNYQVNGKLQIKENSNFTMFDKKNYIIKENLSYNDKMNIKEELKKIINEVPILQNLIDFNAILQ